MKNNMLIGLTAAALLILAGTNLVTFYLYAKEKINSGRTVNAAGKAIKNLKTDAESNLIGFRKDAQKKFLDTLGVLQYGRAEQKKLKEHLFATLNQRNQRIQMLSAGRGSMNEAMTLLKEDGEIFNRYNQYLQMIEERERVLLEKIKPLGNSLGFKPQE